MSESGIETLHFVWDCPAGSADREAATASIETSDFVVLMPLVAPDPERAGAFREACIIVGASCAVYVDRAAHADPTGAHRDPDSTPDADLPAVDARGLADLVLAAARCVSWGSGGKPE